MELSKDTYLYLTKFADDRTILNMLSVNKKFNNEKFFQQIMINKYPLLVRYKQNKETWKQFFIGMVYCISKIEETHNIPYYPIVDYNPKEYCNSPKQTILDGMMAYAALGGHKDIVYLMIQQGATGFDWAMARAAEGGHKDIIELMIQQGATDFDRAMARAAEGGHTDVVKLMIEKGATSFNWAMKEAAHGGHIDIVKLMIQHGATDFNSAMAWAAEYGHKDIVDYLTQIKNNNIK